MKTRERENGIKLSAKDREEIEKGLRRKREQKI